MKKRPKTSFGDGKIRESRFGDEKKPKTSFGDDISYTMPKIDLHVLEGAWNPTLFSYLVQAVLASVGLLKMLRGVFVVRVVVLACLQR